MRTVCLKHVPFEGPGAFATALTAQGISLDRYLVPKDGLPKDAGDLLIVMGGPMSVNDPDSWIARIFGKSILCRSNPSGHRQILSEIRKREVILMNSDFCGR